jgi:hypothetical protein
LVSGAGHFIQCYETGAKAPAVICASSLLGPVCILQRSIFAGEGGSAPVLIFIVILRVVYGLQIWCGVTG